MEEFLFENQLYPVRYRVVTREMESLGLRKNPNIIKYPFREWFFLPEDKISADNNDFGGIWVTRRLSDARRLSKYVNEKYDKETRIFKSIIDKVLYENSYRIKTNGIYLFEELI